MNIVITGSDWLPSDFETLFGDEPYQLIDADNLTDLAVELGGYRSKSQARKSGRLGPIPDGWTEWKVNKKLFAWIWNPKDE